MKLLRAFVTLAEKGSYISASKELFLTQPALSKQIQALEELVDGHVFQRGRHGAALTAFGAQLLPKANELLHAHTNFLCYVKELNKTRNETLFLGFGISSFRNVPIWINRFHHLCPRCEVVINHLSSSVQVNMILEGKLHVGFVRMPVIECLSSYIIHEETLVLAIPSNSNVESINIEQALSLYTLFQLDPSVNPCLAEQTALFLKKNRFNTKPISVTDDITTLLALIAGGNGVAILPESVKYFMPTGVSLLTPVEKYLSWSIGVVWNPKIKSQWRDDFLNIVIDSK
ncbi:LysR family transcriptional regulator [Kluyvera cryocrescens]|uniref:LysR family transcriptional regulator n=1 Tax=Kluyvera cryocrescens TaxID=580 RepID=UPI003D7FBC7C